MLVNKTSLLCTADIDLVNINNRDFTMYCIYIEIQQIKNKNNVMASDYLLSVVCLRVMACTVAEVDAC